MDDTHREFVEQLNRVGLAEWFPQHAASIDAMFAMHMTETGYQPDPV